MEQSEPHGYVSYRVWDLPTRLFHWINALCLIGLIGAGTVILWGGALGVNTEGKILLKTVHVYLGYVFVLNLAFRLVWAFTGNRFARWRSLLPFGTGYGARLRAHVAAARAGTPRHYLGHNPLGRLAVSALLLALMAMAISGLVLAGTDIYFPPFGGLFQEWVAAAGVNPADVAPYVKDNVDAAAFADMRAFRKPFILVHYWTFFVLLGLIVLHIGAVIHAEVKAGGGLISAMFTGRKVLPRAPADRDEAP